jgi:Ca2+-binding EF-hand superfamily protein
MTTLSKLIAASALTTCIIGSTGLVFAQTTAAPAQTNATSATEQTAPNKHRQDARDHHNRMIDRLFAKYDPQKTGFITVDAFLKPADDRFAKIDTKHQGFIDKDELTAYIGSSHPEEIDRTIKRLDTNADGKITKDEFEKPLRKRFALLDLKDEGKISREEAELALPSALPHGHMGKGRHRAGADQGGQQ